MTEPTATAAAAGAGIMVAGLATGLPADLILPAFVGALASLRAMEEGGPWARVLQVFAGTLIAAWTAAPVSLLAGDILPAASRVPIEMLRYPVAFLLGWGGLRFVLPRFEKIMGGAK